MPERRYMNRRPGEECILIEFRAQEIPLLLEDLEESSIGVNAPTSRLIALLREAQGTFALGPNAVVDFPEVRRRGE